MRALVLRGVYSKEGYTSGGGLPRTTYDVNFRTLLDNYQTYLFPYFDDIYFVSYTNGEEDDQWLISQLQPKDYRFIDYDSNNQITCFVQSLDIVPEDTYDEICITRFDLVWKIPFGEVVDYDHEVFNFLWKEVEWRWKDHHCVADPLHIFHGDLLPELKRIMPLYRSQDTTLHYVWPLFAKELGVFNLDFLFDGYYNSNPADLIETGKPVLNPLFYIWRGNFNNSL